MKILYLTIDLGSNATGRTEVLWSLARAEGWETNVVAPSGDRIWGPVTGTEFAENCEVLRDSVESEMKRLKELALASDVIIAVKPLPGSFDRGLALAQETGVPLIIDVDDPSLEARLRVGSPFKSVLRLAKRPVNTLRLRRLRHNALRAPHVIVSNPVLQDWYGGAVVPHAKADTGEGRPHTSTHPVVVFVGTNHAHKGIGLVRTAVAQTQEQGVRLVVTDSAPADAQPWEDFVGRTSLDEGLELVRNGDIVVLASDPGTAWARAQLPAKLIDAMVAGRALIVGDVPPLVWAAGDGGLVLREHSAEAIAERLRELADPERRAQLGKSARNRASTTFTIDAVRPAFRDAVLAAVRRSD